LNTKRLPSAEKPTANESSMTGTGVGDGVGDGSIVAVGIFVAGAAAEAVEVAMGLDVAGTLQAERTRAVRSRNVKRKGLRVNFPPSEMNQWRVHNPNGYGWPSTPMIA